MENNELYNRINKYKFCGDKELLNEIIDQFNPLLKKYAYKLNDEDGLQDLIIFFIQLIKKNKD